MIELAGDAPCWTIQTSNPDLDEFHTATREAAEAEARCYPEIYVDAVVAQLSRCCYIAYCDECGAAEGSAECAGFHLPADPDTVLARLGELAVALDGRLLCEACRDQADRALRGEQARIEMRRELQVDATALRLPGL